jgi:exodeoxyribonuclease VII large subunit
VLQDADGHVLASVAGLAAGDPVSVRVADGRLHATTTRTETTTPLVEPDEEDTDE